MSVEFSALHLIIGEQRPTLDKLKTIFDGRDDTNAAKETHYLIEKENIDDKYFWLCARFGRSKPYSKRVYNISDHKEEDNPRSIDQVETHKQLFVLYCLKTGTLYLSNNKQKNWLAGYLKRKLGEEVSIKAYYKNADEFLKIIRSVEKVKLVVKKNLLTEHAGIMRIFKSSNDLYGLGMPADFTLDTNFNRSGLTASFKEILKKMEGWKNKNEADSLLCIGRDDKGFETIFNADSFIQKISIEIARDEQDLYDPTMIKQALINKLGGL